MLESLAEHRRLDEGKSLQTYMSCLLKKGELEITTYLGAEAFYPGHFAAAGEPCLTKRSTLRRGDSYLLLFHTYHVVNGDCSAACLVCALHMS
jgi:hypothetical protein